MKSECWMKVSLGGAGDDTMCAGSGRRARTVTCDDDGGGGGCMQSAEVSVSGQRATACPTLRIETTKEPPRVPAQSLDRRVPA